MHKIIFLNFIRTRKQQSSISHHFKALPSIRWSWNIILAIDHSFLPLCFIVKHESWCWCCFQFLTEIPAWITFVFLFCAFFWDSRERKITKRFRRKSPVSLLPIAYYKSILRQSSRWYFLLLFSFLQHRRIKLPRKIFLKRHQSFVDGIFFSFLFLRLLKRIIIVPRFEIKILRRRTK